MFNHKSLLISLATVALLGSADVPATAASVDFAAESIKLELKSWPLYQGKTIYVTTKQWVVGPGSATAFIFLTKGSNKIPLNGDTILLQTTVTPGTAYETDHELMIPYGIEPSKDFPSYWLRYCIMPATGETTTTNNYAIFSHMGSCFIRAAQHSSYPGDFGKVLEGQFGPILPGFIQPTEVHVAWFWAEKGSKLKLKLKDLDAGFLHVTLNGPDGENQGGELLSFEKKNPEAEVKGDHPEKKAKFKIKETGIYRVVISATHSGSFALKWKLKSKKKGKATLSQELGARQSIDIPAPAGSQLEVVAEPTRRFQGGRLVLEVKDPEGHVVARAEADDDGKLRIDGVPVRLNGSHQIVVDGIHGRKSIKVTAKVLTKQADMLGAASDGKAK